MILKDTTHSDCTDETCKKFDVSDLEIAGTRPLERKEEPASLEESASLDATLEMSPSLDATLETSPLSQLDENDLISLHQVNICKLYKSIELSSVSESKLGRTMEDELNELEDLLDTPSNIMDSSFISQGSYGAWDADDADVVVETPEGDDPVTCDTTAHMGQRVNSDNMDVTGAEAKEAETANPVKLSRKLKRNPTIMVSGVEHVTIPATEWHKMT